MAQEAQNRVQTSIRDFVNSVDKSHLRGMEREMHLCAADCCGDKTARLLISNCILKISIFLENVILKKVLIQCSVAIQRIVHVLIH